MGKGRGESVRENVGSRIRVKTWRWVREEWHARGRQGVVDI